MRGPTALSLLRAWLWGTGAVLILLIVWTIAPVLFLVLLLTAALGLLSALMIALARRLEAWKSARTDRQ